MYKDVAIAQELNREINKNENLNENQDSKKSEDETPQRPKGLFKEFLFVINPINPEEWKGGSFLIKILLILRSPFMFLLQLFVPVVNETAEKRGWSKLLNCLQISITPIFALLVLGRKTLFILIKIKSTI